MTSSAPEPQDPVADPPPGPAAAAAPTSYALPQPYPAPCGSAYPATQPAGAATPAPAPAPSTPPAPPPAPPPSPVAAPTPYAPTPYAPTPYATPASYGSAPVGYAYAAATPPTNGSALTGFILAILSFVTLPVVLAIVALVLSSRGLAAIEADPARQSGRGLALWGRGLAIANLVVFGLIGLFLAAVGVGLLIGSR